MNFITSCITCKAITPAGLGYWHLMKCEAYQAEKKRRENA